MTKQEILSRARTVLLEKQAGLQTMLSDLQEGLANDTKSSAGDKYETSRAMSQQEMDKVAVQLQEITRQLALIPQLENAVTTVKAQNGSLVETASGFFFIGLPIGKLEIGPQSVFCISPTSPLAQQLIGLSAGDSYTINNVSQTIRAIS